MIAIFAGVILVLLVTILVILFRKRICCYASTDKDGDKVSGTSTESSALANNVILKVNNMDQMSNDSTMLKLGRAGTPSQISNEVDSSLGGPPWDGEDFRNNTTTQLFRQNSDLEPDFPPKPVRPAAFFFISFSYQ